MITPALSRRLAVVRPFAPFEQMDDREWERFLTRAQTAERFEALRDEDQGAVIRAEAQMPAILRTRWKRIEQERKPQFTVVEIEWPRDDGPAAE